jgi:hypothetical protein
MAPRRIWSAWRAPQSLIGILYFLSSALAASWAFYKQRIVPIIQLEVIFNSLQPQLAK